MGRQRGRSGNFGTFVVAALFIVVILFIFGFGFFVISWNVSSTPQANWEGITTVNTEVYELEKEISELRNTLVELLSASENYQTQITDLKIKIMTVRPFMNSDPEEDFSCSSIIEALRLCAEDMKIYENQYERTAASIKDKSLVSFADDIVNGITDSLGKKKL